MNREKFFSIVSEHIKMPEELRKIQRAYWLAKLAHSKQTRDSGERYFEHPRAVCLLAIENGLTDCDSICISLLHDAVEDTYTPADVYITTCGMKVWKGIETLSKKIPHHHELTGKVSGYIKKSPEEYFQTIRLSPYEVRTIKVLDRVHNLSTCNDWPKERREKYFVETKQHIVPIADTVGRNLSEKLAQLMV